MRACSALRGRALVVSLAALAILAGVTPVHGQGAPPSGSASARDMARALRVLRASPIMDGHNDLPWRIREDTVRPRDVEAYDLRTRTPGMTDLARLRRGHVGAQFWSVYIPGDPGDAIYAPNGKVTSSPGYTRLQLEQIDIARRVIARYPALRWTPTVREVRAAIRSGAIASLLGLEGGHAIENSLEVLRMYHELGARYMTLTHNVTLDWADAALDSARHGGLTAFGREVVGEMNRLGMLVDLSHVSPGTMSDALDVTTAPVIFSHSGARALVNHPRNVPDSILARLPGNGGVVMVPFVTVFVSASVKAHDDSLQAVMASSARRHGHNGAAMRAEIAAWNSAHPRPSATIADVADQIEHVRRIAGVDHVGLGADFDGISENVVGLEDVSTYPSLFAELVRRGWSDSDLAKLANRNALRVLARAEQVSARVRTGRSRALAPR